MHCRIPIAEIRRLLASRAGQPVRWDRQQRFWRSCSRAGRTKSRPHFLPSGSARVAGLPPRTKSHLQSPNSVGTGKPVYAVSSRNMRRARNCERAAVSCVEHMDPGAKAQRAALFTVAGERHTLGLTLAELVLAEGGTGAIWLGEGPPREELDVLVEKTRPAILVVSASPASSSKSVLSYQKALTKTVKRHHVPLLVLGGGGPWARQRPANRAVTFCELREILERLNTKGAADHA